MPTIGRSQRASYRGPRTPKRGRSGLAAIAVTAVIGVLAVSVAVLSYNASHRSKAASGSDISALEARIDSLAGQLAGVQQTARTAAADAQRSLSTVRKIRVPKTPAQQANLGRCLSQMQRELDDLYAYLAYRVRPHRGRVTGSCATLLKPRFGK